jgi:hypothetical protein
MYAKREERDHEGHGASRSVYASHPSREVAELIKDAGRQTKSE